MTDDPDPPTPTDPEASPPVAPDPAIGAPPPARPGLGTFTIEGRAAPGLFVLGWLASILGLGITLVAVQAGHAALIPLLVGLALLSIGLISGAGAQALERRARGAAYTGPSPVLLFAATIPVVFLAAIVVGAIVGAARVVSPGPAVELLLLTIQAAIYIGLVGLLVVGTGALTWREIGFNRSVGGAIADIAWGALFALPVIAVTLVLTIVLVGLFRATPESPLPPTGSNLGLVLHLIAGAVVAPVAEEVLFRGVATTAWVRTYGVTSGIVRSAIFFAAAHVLTVGGTNFQDALGMAIVGFAGRLPIALVLGWVYVRRGSIWASIGLHSAFNAVLLILGEAAIRAAG